MSSNEKVWFQATRSSRVWFYADRVGHGDHDHGNRVGARRRQFQNKKTLILGSGGATPSIIIGLKRLGVENITISNRTKDKAIKLKEKFNFLEILEWGQTINAEIVLNTTSLGLKESDNIKLDYSMFGSDSFFYDLIYNPKETNFLKNAKKHGCLIQNGLMMFVYQASEAFKTWHNIQPNIDKNLISFLEND